MTPTRAFGRLLAETRREQGYATPYAFFRGRGGRRGLGLTFPNYLSLERGENLPKGWRLERLLDALGLLPHSTAWRRLVRTYLVELVGSETLVAGLEGPAAAADPAPAALRLAESASKQALARVKAQLDVGQYGLLAKDPLAYACHVILCNTGGWTDLKALAAAAGAPAAAVRRSLAALSAAGMVKLSGGKARSAFEDSFLEPPAPTPALASVYARLARAREAWSARGAVVHAPYLLLRAKRGDMQRFQEHLTEVVKMSAVFGDMQAAADSDMYLVEGRVTRLFGKKA